MKLDFNIFISPTSLLGYLEGESDLAIYLGYLELG